MATNFTVPITVVTRTISGEDAYGKDVFTETTRTVKGIFAPTSGSSGTASSTESDVARDQIISKSVVFLPDIDVTAIDRIEVLGVSYEVEGTPLRWPANPISGWRPEFPIEVALTKVAG